jgi:hypothetical protein
LTEEDYLTMTTAEPAGDAVAGLDAQEAGTPSSLSSASSLPPSTQADLLVSYPGFTVSPFNEPVFGAGGDELPADIDDFQFLALHTNPWNGLGLSDIDFMLPFDIESHGGFLEEVMGPIEDALGYQEMYSPFDDGSPSPLSVTQHLPMEVSVADNPNPTQDFYFAAPLLLLDIGISEPTTPPWSSLWPQEFPSASSTILSQPSPNSRINSVSTTSRYPSLSPILCSWEGCGKTFLTNTAFKYVVLTSSTPSTIILTLTPTSSPRLSKANFQPSHHLKYHTRPFHCPHCPLQQATKRLLHRHINERHFNTEKYYCTVESCNRSMYGDLGNGGRHFTREDNCRRHLRKIHGMAGMGEELGWEMARQAKDGGQSGVVDMDELTRRIRVERKVGRRKVG